MRIMHSCPNIGVNYHIFENKGNYTVIPIYTLILEQIQHYYKTKPPQGKSTGEIPRLDPNTPHRTLGVYLTPDIIAKFEKYFLHINENQLANVIVPYDISSR